MLVDNFTTEPIDFRPLSRKIISHLHKLAKHDVRC